MIQNLYLKQISVHWIFIQHKENNILFKQFYLLCYQLCGNKFLFVIN
jgi:hypothetical protein